MKGKRNKVSRNGAFTCGVLVVIEAMMAANGTLIKEDPARKQPLSQKGETDYFKRNLPRESHFGHLRNLTKV